jgi:catechol 2,3-dioxygenase-like lactoylglutathione lyase family enzyme
VKLKSLVPMLSVVDLKRTVAFYCGELGFRCRSKFGDPDPVWCHLERDGVSLMFNQPPASRDGRVAASSQGFSGLLLLSR